MNDKCRASVQLMKIATLSDVQIRGLPGNLKDLKASRRALTIDG